MCDTRCKQALAVPLIVVAILVALILLVCAYFARHQIKKLWNRVLHVPSTEESKQQETNSDVERGTVPQLKQFAWERDQVNAVNVSRALLADSLELSSSESLTPADASEPTPKKTFMELANERDALHNRMVDEALCKSGLRRPPLRVKQLHWRVAMRV